MFNFLGTIILLSTVAVHFTFPPTTHKGSNHLLFFDSGTANLMAGKWYLTVVWIWVSLMIRNVSHLFMSFGHLCIFTGEISIQALWPCFNQFRGSGVFSLLSVSIPPLFPSKHSLSVISPPPIYLGFQRPPQGGRRTRRATDACVRAEMFSFSFCIKL